MGNIQKLLAVLILYKHNTHILHWNIHGLDFDPTHALLSEYYTQIEEYIDDIAELGIQLGIQPISLQKALSILQNDSESGFLSLEGDEEFTSNECYGHIDMMFNQLINIYESITKDSNIPGDIVNKLQEHQQWFRKQCRYKNKRRLQ